MLRVIREVQPKWVVGENVFGLINWDGGLVFDQVQIDLEAEGYEVQAYVLPAVSQDAPHRRDRVWFVAYRTGNRWQWQGPCIEIENREQKPGSVGELARGFEGLCSIRNAPDPDQLNGNLSGLRASETPFIEASGIRKNITADPCIEGHKGSERRGSYGQRNRTEISGSTAKRFEIRSWDNWPTQSPICNGNDGLRSELVGITFPKWRNEGIKAMGNAIVPQVVLQIFKAINEYEKGNTC